jgi:SAM-dependent methyltransferase
MIAMRRLAFRLALLLAVPAALVDPVAAQPPPPTSAASPPATVDQPPGVVAAAGAAVDRFVHPLTGRQVSGTLPAARSAILEREGREERELPEKILDHLGLKPGDVVADVGAGIGWYTRRLARRIGPDGKVLAVDVQQGMLDQLVERMRAEGVTNVFPILGDVADPKLPAGEVDWILLVDVYHEFADPIPMLERLRASLEPGTGRVALVEYRGERLLDTMDPIPDDHKMTVEDVLVEWGAAGFELETLYGFLPHQHFFVMKPKEPPVN